MQTMYNVRNTDQWLLSHAMNVTSLEGEDGILRKIFEVLKPSNPWCVEFGAWDGKLYSNTFQLISSGTWSGVMIEADEQKFRELCKTFQNNRKVTCLHKFVTFDGEHALDALLAQTSIPKSFELLSVDIDGNDYHIWASLENYTPKVVVIEFNPTIPNHVEFVQPRDMHVNQGTSLLSIVKLGVQKGYELICITDQNAILTRKDLFPLFNIGNNSIEQLHPNRFPQFHVFQLYDGTFVVGGRSSMVWQNDLPIRQDKFQIIPRCLRDYPLWSGSKSKNALRRLWRYFYKRGVL